MFIEQCENGPFDVVGAALERKALTVVAGFDTDTL